MGLWEWELWALSGRVLSEVERQVLHARFREGLTLKEVGTRRGVGRERVRQIEVKALAKLAQAAGAAQFLRPQFISL